MSRKPAKGGPRHINLMAPNKRQIELLRGNAYALLDFPELLDKPEWRHAALEIVRAFITQNPWPPLGPRNVAALVDEIIDTQVQRNVPLAQAVQTARSDVAEVLRPKFTRSGVKMAHLRYGKLGVKPRR